MITSQDCTACGGTGNGWLYSFDWAKHVCYACGVSGKRVDQVTRQLNGEAARVLARYRNRIMSETITDPPMP